MDIMTTREGATFPPPDTPPGTGITGTAITTREGDGVDRAGGEIIGGMLFS